MKNFLLIICKNGTLKNQTITDYSENNLENIFRYLNIKEASFLVYDMKLNKYAEGSIDRDYSVKPLRRKKWDF